MARQIAHEIKNPLTPIKLSVQHLRRAYRDRRADFGDILDDSVTQILNEIDRLTEIARAFSRYGAPGAEVGPVERVDASAVARDALTLYRSSDSAIEFRSAIEPGLPFVRARAGELKEVILNLLENARDALEGQGIIEVQLYSVGEAVALDVVDDGPGIPEVLQERIFDPHFSTRSSGTGLGLAIVRRIVESWGGTITVESTPGAGTVMHVRMLPADDGRPPLQLHRDGEPQE
jgi:signal transduction histidine kinase